MSHSSKNNKLRNQVGVIGHPINHSKSPLIHNHFIHHYSLDANYSAVSVETGDDLRRFIDNVKVNNWIGFNVTIPYKQTILSYLDEIDQTVETIQACNTVVIKNNRLHGYNTDAAGFYYPIQHQSFQGALVLGNGGASKAVLYQLCVMGVQTIYVVARHPSKSELFINQLNQTFNLNIKVITFNELSSESSILKKVQLIVNATSVGLNDNDEVFKGMELVNHSHTFYDLIYNPWNTKMMNQCRANAATVINGAYMLAHQAALAFELFFNKPADTNVMYQLMHKDQVS